MFVDLTRSNVTMLFITFLYLTITIFVFHSIQCVASMLTCKQICYFELHSNLMVIHYFHTSRFIATYHGDGILYEESCFYAIRIEETCPCFDFIFLG